MGLTFVFISDTHLEDLSRLPEGDILVHSGDWCGAGPVARLKADGRSQLDRFASQLKRWVPQFQKTIIIAGNHDFIAEAEPELTKSAIEDTGAVYLNDSGYSFGGFNFWGSPIQPWFHDWAYNRQRGDEIRHHWDLIPENTDVLITHGPPYGILDRIYSGEKPHVGCEELLIAVRRVKPRIHAFGHIHEAYGQEKHGETLFVNAAVLNERYLPQNPPIVVEV